MNNRRQNLAGEIQNLAGEIKSAIEREELDGVTQYIKDADDFLFNKENSAKPDFLDDFFVVTKNMLVTTVNGCIKSRNNPKRKDDLKKYKEGYFNEIIQNANDVVLKSEVKNPIVEIVCEKSENNEYSMTCTYPDKGFSLTDIYGFCSRGNSNKSSESGQEGMYGIGIKSLFCFVTYFCIENNIKIEVSSNGSLLDTCKIDCLDRALGYTKLTLKFQYDCECIANNKHAGFNIEKLASFMDTFIDGDTCSGDYDKFFYSEKENEIIFDPRSLIFTELKNNRNVENSIKVIKFTVKDNNGKEISLSVNDTYYKIDSSIKISMVKDNMKYLVFHFEDTDNDENSLSLAYRINEDWNNLGDRIYATYFVCNYSNLLELRTGCLVNTKAINSSRSGLERENESDPVILKKIKEKGKFTVDRLTEILNSDNEYKWKEAASDILCHLLYLYKDNQIQNEGEMCPTGIFKDKANALYKLCSNNKLYLTNDKHYVFNAEKDDKIDYNNQIIQKNRPANSDDDNCRSIFLLFKSVFIATDTIFFVNNNCLSYGVQILAETILSDYQGWLNLVKLPFLNGAKKVITERIGGNDFKQILGFIKDKNHNERILIKQLIARYEINRSFDYMGNYSHGNIRNWLFNNSDNINDESFKLCCKEYEMNYKDLKNLLQGKIVTLKYYYSCNWNADSDYWYNGFNISKFSDLRVSVNQISQFLSLLSKEIIHIGYNQDSASLFAHNMDNENLILRNRTRTTNSWDGELRYFSIDFLNRIIPDFNSFKMLRQLIDECNNKLNIDRKLNFLTKCKIEKADLPLIADMFRWLSEYEQKVNINVKSLGCVVNCKNSDIINFAKLFIGDISVSLKKIDAGKNGAKFIGYITNLNENYYKIKYRGKKADGIFSEISFDATDRNCVTDEKKHLIVFYSNSDEQTALSDVLFDLGYGEEISEYINNFINIDNVKQLSSSDYDKYLDRVERTYKYSFENNDVISFLEEIRKLTMEEIFTVLSGEMSYNDHCPICNDIPTLNVKGLDKVSENKNCLVIILPARYNEKTIYIKTICCKSCFEEYKVSLTCAEIIEANKQKILQLKNTICDPCRSFDLIKPINLSPDNWEIIRDFNDLVDKV